MVLISILDAVTAQHIKAPVLPNPDTLCPKNVGFIWKQLQACRTAHDKCHSARNSLGPQYNPKYLVDLKSAGEGHGRLVEMEAASRLYSYAALSYCWGPGGEGEHRQETLQGNLQSRMNRFSLNDLPHTIRDAVQVCLRLKIRYLWVDAICIVQDGKDKQREIGQMYKVYQAADLVINATRACDSDEGFLGPRLQAYDQYEVNVDLHFPDRTESGVVRLTERVTSDWARPVDSRAWTLQEDLVATRTVYFTGEELEWRCLTERKHESDIYLYRLCDSRELGGYFKHYLTAVADYSRRQIRFAGDRLLAFEMDAMGRARQLGYGPGDYRAGLWRPEMERQLLWQCEHGRDRQPSVDVSRAPSWSWAATELPVTWDSSDMQYLDWKDYTCEIEDCVAYLTDPNQPFGAVNGGLLKVRAYAPEAFWTGKHLIEFSRPLRRSARLSGNSGQATGRSRGSAPGGIARTSCVSGKINLEGRILPFLPTWDTACPLSAQAVKCLEVRCGVQHLRIAYGLVLKPAKGGRFKRIGYFQFKHPTKQARDGNGLVIDGENWLQRGGKESVHII